MHELTPAMPPPALPPPGAHLHLVGVCGAGMTPLALALRAGGWVVTGEDRSWPADPGAVLAAGGVRRAESDALPNDAAAVIFSSAVGPSHPTLQAAAARRLPVMRRGEALAALVRGRRLIAIVGSHGKTTTSAMLITAARAAGLSCDYLLGGLFADRHTPPARWTGAEWVIAEVDESDGTIAGFEPEVMLCVNLDWDHCDRYREPAAIEAAFAALAARTRQAVFLHAGCPWSRRALGVEPAGGRGPRGGATRILFGCGGDYALTGIAEASAAGQTLQLGGRFAFDHARIAAVGGFNAENATGALAVAAWLGAEDVRELLAAYPGVLRRQALLPAPAGITIMADYAHHPTEIAALLGAVHWPGTRRLMAVFQPHRFTRTAQFKNEFARVLATADQVYLLDVYAASEAPVAGGTSADVLASLHALDRAPPAELLADVAAAPQRLADAIREGDLVLFIGAGDIEDVAQATSQLLCKSAKSGATGSNNLRDAFMRALPADLSPETVVRFDEPLAPKTTMRVGGNADVFVEPASTADLQAVLRAARALDLPVFLLGRGSNLIVADEGVRGVVIRLRHAHWRRFACLGPGRYWAGAGLRLKELCGRACKLGETGFEFLEGIPGTVGGGLRMNAGAMGGAMFEVVDQVHYLDREGRLHVRRREELHVEYRACRELQTGIAIGAVLRTRGPAEVALVRQRIAELQRNRMESQPLEPSAGCIFKNPPGDSAGRIIDELGLKGLRVGDAEVSATHANFIINRGRATGADVLALVRRVREEVRRRRKIELEPEVLLCGRRWEDVLS